jgi:branched-chain amino acid transport system permease protein
MVVEITDVIQSFLGGVLQGGFYALSAVGLSLIFGVQRILNVAQGAFIVLASFVTVQFSFSITPRLHVDPIFSILLDIFVIGAVGIVSYFVLIYRIEKTGFEAPLLATFGLSIFIEYIIANGLVIDNHVLIPILDPSFGNGATPANQAYSTGYLALGSIRLQEPQLIAFVIAIVVLPLLHLFLTKTFLGRSIRATAQDWQAAEFSGIDIRFTRAASFTIGSALAGLAGGVFAFTTPVVPTAGDTVILSIALAVIILGGVGSVLGTLVGGIFVGVVIALGDFVALEVLTQYRFPADFGQLIAFLIFLIVLMVKPAGLFGIRLRK